MNTTHRQRGAGRIGAFLEKHKSTGVVAPLAAFLLIGAIITTYTLDHQQNQITTVAEQAKSIANPVIDVCNGTDTAAAITLDRHGLCGRAADVTANPVVANPGAGSVITRDETTTVTVSPAPIEITQPGRQNTVTQTETAPPLPQATVTRTPAPPSPVTQTQTNTVTRTETPPAVTQTQTQTQTETATQTVQAPPTTVTETQQAPVQDGSNGGSIPDQGGGSNSMPMPGATPTEEAPQTEQPKSNLLPGIPLLGTGN
jgi:hypothetical protein